MKPEFSAGDLIITKEVASSSLEIGDIITYRSIDPRIYNEIITHEIVGETYYQDTFAFITKGINTNENDIYPAMNHLILGKLIGNLANAGYVIDYLNTTQGYILLVFVPFLVLAGLEIKELVKIYKHKKTNNIHLLEKEKEALQQELSELKKKLQTKDETKTHDRAPNH
jgi:signal peptidase